MISLDPKFNMALVQMTNRCNIECRHCYVSSHPHGSFGLGRHELFRLVDQLQEAGIGRIALSGGEPLSRAEDALQTLRCAKGRLDLLLLTNAMLITERVAAELVDIAPTIRVSLDGASAEVHDRMRGKGSFLRTLRGVERLLSAGFDPRGLEFFATLPDDAVDQVSGILRLAEGFGVERMKFEPVSRTGRAVESWGAHDFSGDDPQTRSFRATFEGITNAAGGSDWSVHDINDTGFRVLTIYENGDVFPYTWTEERDRAVGYLGNLRKQELSEILSSDRLSVALLTKVAMMARGPERSLRALRLLRRTAQGEVAHV